MSHWALKLFPVTNQKVCTVGNQMETETESCDFTQLELQHILWESVLRERREKYPLDCKLRSTFLTADNSLVPLNTTAAAAYDCNSKDSGSQGYRGNTHGTPVAQ